MKKSNVVQEVVVMSTEKELQEKENALDEARKAYEMARMTYIESACRTKSGEKIDGADAYTEAAKAMVRCKLDYEIALWGPEHLFRSLGRKEGAFVGASTVCVELDEEINKTKRSARTWRLLYVAREARRVLELEYMMARELCYHMSKKLF